MRRFKALIALAPVALASCVPLACEEMGCIGMLSLSVDGATWQEGAEYALSVDLGDDGIETCTWTWSTESDDQPTCAQVDPDGAVHMDINLGMGVAPESISVALEEDGADLLADDVFPEWSEPYYPNGERCDGGNGCQSASVTIAL